jgi:hypothetical protein
MPMPPSPLARLGAFRSELHGSFTRRADVLFELGDALLCSQTPLLSLPHLGLEPTHRRGWGSAYAALASGRIATERLRDLLVSHLPPADPLVFAVDVTTWPRCDAECSPERGYYYHPRATRPASRSSPAGPTNGSPSSASTVTPGPPGRRGPAAPLGRHRPAGRLSGPGAAWAAARRGAGAAGRLRRRLRLRPAHLGSGRGSRGRAGAAARRPLLLRRPTASGALTQRRAAAPPWRQVRLRRLDHLAGPDRHPRRCRRPVRHRDRGRLERAATQAATPSRPRQPRTATDRARHHPPRPGGPRPGPHPPAQGAVAMVGRPRRVRPGPGLAGLCSPLRPGAHRSVL